MANAKIVIGDNGGQIDISESLGATGASGYGQLYVDSSDKTLHYVDGDGTDTDISTASPTGLESPDGQSIVVNNDIISLDNTFTTGGDNCIALGSNNTVGISTINIGFSNTSSGGNANGGISIGYSNTSSDGIAIGRNNNMSRAYSFGISNSNTTGNNFHALALGVFNSVGKESVAVGKNNSVSGQASYSFGYNNNIERNNNYAIGRDNSIPSSAGTNNSIVGSFSSTIGSTGSYNAIVGSKDGTISGSLNGAVILGGDGITATADNTVYVPILHIESCPEAADNATAITAGLTGGDVYKTATGELRIVV